VAKFLLSIIRKKALGCDTRITVCTEGNLKSVVDVQLYVRLISTMEKESIFKHVDFVLR
jgi:hypothetical protein